jgi:hypothetical protein
METSIKNPLIFLLNTERNQEMISSFNCIVDVLTHSSGIESAKKSIETDLTIYFYDYFSIIIEENSIKVIQKKFPNQSYTSFKNNTILIFS